MAQAADRASETTPTTLPGKVNHDVRLKLLQTKSSAEKTAGR
jgi:hypothetical protein